MKLEKWKNKWKKWSNLRKWQIWKLKLIDARLYFVSIFVGLLTGLVAVPYHYLLWYFFDVRKTFFTAHYPWYWHVLLFFILWGILIFVASLVKRMPLIAGGGIPQTRAANNGRIRYEHPFKELVAKFCGGVLALSAGLSLGREGPSVQIGSYIGTLISRWGHILKGERKQLLAAGAGAGLSAAFAAPLSSSLLVIESIERYPSGRALYYLCRPYGCHCKVLFAHRSFLSRKDTCHETLHSCQDVVFIDHSLCHIVNRDESDRWRRAVFDDAGNEWNS